jgi:sodium transport system permease protein
MLSHILNIWRKELTDSLRDRKALRQSLLIPLVIGVMYAVMNPVIGSIITQRAQDPIVIPTQGVEYARQDFIDLLARFDITLVAHTGDLQARIASGQEAAGLIIPPDFGDAIAAEEPAHLTLLTNPSAGGLFVGNFSGQRLDLAISTYNQQISISRVQARNMDPTLLSPITLETHDLASPAQMAGILASFMLPLLVVIIVAQGGLFIAIDVTAGEKERGTLEALLVTPATDLEVFTGKLLAVFTVSVVPFVLALVGFWLAGTLLPESITDGATLPFRVILVAIAAGIPLALLMAVVLMMVSVRTKTFKDAQSAAAPLTIGALIPAFAAAIVTPTGPLAYLIPMYGPAAMVGQVAIRGGDLDATALLLSIIGSLIGAAIAFVLAARLFDRERLLYSA